MWSIFNFNRKSKKSKVVISFFNKKIVGWGIRFNMNNKHAIMLYVSKLYRRKKIGTTIYKKLSRGIKRSKLEAYPDKNNKKFFNTLYS